MPAVLIACQSAQARVYLTPEQAQALMFPGQTLTPLPVVLSAADIAAIEKRSGVQVFAGSLSAWKADNGYFFTDPVIGKHDLIRYAVALDAQGKVRAVEILEYREANGGEVRNTHWLHQFVGLAPGDTVKIGHGIRNISGATLSSARRALARHGVQGDESGRHEAEDPVQQTGGRAPSIIDQVVEPVTAHGQRRGRCHHRNAGAQVHATPPAARHVDGGAGRPGPRESQSGRRRAVATITPPAGGGRCR